MRKAITIALLLATAACSKVPAGNVGVKAYLLGGNKGVDAEVLGPGRYWIGWNEELYLFPTFTQTKTWEAGEEGDHRLTFQDVDGAKIKAGVGVTYNIDRAKAYKLFQTYRRGIDEITDIFLHNMIRDAMIAEASRLKVDVIYGTGKEDMLQRVEKRVRAQVAPIGINIERIYWIGDMALPSSVQEALNAKIAATQNAMTVENRLRTAEANARIRQANAEATAKAKITEAEAEADANRKIAASISPELVRYINAQKWDGKLPTVSGSATPIIDLR